MIVVYAQLPIALEWVEIVPIGDAHDGDECFDEKALIACVEYIAASPNRYCILNGDMMNIALKNSKSDVYSDVRNPNKQIDHIKSILDPIAKKILAITGGNHEYRVALETTIDISEILAARLGCIDRYALDSYVLFVSVGKADTRGDKITQHVYSLYCHHGYGGGKKSGSKLNNVISLNDTVDADVYVMNHLHTPAATKSDYFRLDYQHKKAVQITRTYVLANAWLKFGGYGQRKGYSPSTITITRIKLSGRHKKHVEITI
jgi:predicted phosphodiesterase